MPQKLKCVVRYDSVPLGQTYFTEEGYLVDRPILTSTGIFEYPNEDGSVRRELRPPEEVFAQESLVTYKGKPIIITHDAGLITKDNVHEESVGTILSEGYRSGSDVRAEIIIHDTDEMRNAGLKELSLGYNLELDETPGTWKGRPYDAIQRNITINHLALVLEARAGEQARLNIDSKNGKSKGATTTMSKSRKKTRKPGRAERKTRRTDGVLSPEELEKAIKAYKERQARRPDKQDEEEEEETRTPAAETAPQPKEDEEPEEKVQYVKKRRDRRDEEGDPESPDEAMEVIAQQDDDIDLLFDIIDSLLAERDFAKDAEEEAGPVGEGDENLNEDEEEEAPAGEEEDFAEDEDEDAEDEEFAEDEDEEEEDTEEEDFAEDEDDEDIPRTKKSAVTSSGLREPALKTDSIDRIVRQRVQIGMAAQALHMDGLENMNLTQAKKTVIHAVRPALRLDGRSTAYIDAAFDCAVSDVMRRQRKTTKYQKKQMFNRDAAAKSRRAEGTSSREARERMIRRQTSHHKKEAK